jgi:hypothetical protein
MAITSLNNINQLIFVMMKCGVLFEVRTEFLNIIYTNFGFKVLMLKYLNACRDLNKKCNASTMKFLLKVAVIKILIYILSVF